MRGEDKVNEVQAMEELEMTSSEQFEGNDRFTWIPFYMEMAKKLLEYKDDRRELVKIVYEMDEKYISFFIEFSFYILTYH